MKKPRLNAFEKKLKKQDRDIAAFKKELTAKINAKPDSPDRKG